jgi:hypothetical protein
MNDWDPSCDRFCPGCGRPAEIVAARVAPAEYWVAVARCEALVDDVAVCSSEDEAWRVISEWAQSMEARSIRGTGGIGTLEVGDSIGQEWMFDVWGPRKIDAASPARPVD